MIERRMLGQKGLHIACFTDHAGRSDDCKKR
jgi:hypothetical protein